MRFGSGHSSDDEKYGGLHTIAGSENVIEFHGSVHRNYCVRCGRRYDADFIANSKGIPVCESCGGTVRPDVVLYGERIDEQVITDSVNAVRGADCMIVIGTSLVVYPAAGLIHYAPANAPVYLIDPHEVLDDPHVHFIQKGASEGVKELTGMLLQAEARE